MNNIRKGYISVIQAVKDAKEVWAALGAIVVGVVGIMGYLSTNFLSAEAAEISHKQMVNEMVIADREMAEQIRNLATEVGQTNSLLSLHMDKHSLDAVNLAIQSNETEIFNLEQIIRKDGSNKEANLRLVKLRGQRDELVIKRQCIVTGNPRCD